VQNVEKEIETFRARTGKLNRFYAGVFEYHICIELDTEHPSSFDDVVVLRSAEDRSYFQSISVHDEDNTEKVTIDGIQFLVVKFQAVKPKKRYHCYVDQGVDVHGRPETPEGIWYVFQDFYIDFDDRSDEGEPDIKE